MGRFWVLVYSDDRELNLSAFHGMSNLKLLKTGPGKVQAATMLSNYLTSSLRAGGIKPEVISVGTAQALQSGSEGCVVSPEWAIDRDIPIELLKARGLVAPPSVRLGGTQGVNMGSGDSELTAEAVEGLQGRNINWVDTDAHSLGWVSIRCLAGRVHAVRYVTHSVGSAPPKDWGKALEQARPVLTTSVLQLTAAGVDA